MTVENATIVLLLVTTAQTILVGFVIKAWAKEILKRLDRS